MYYTFSAVLTKAKALLECLNNFHNGVDEVSMAFTKQVIQWSSFQFGAPGVCTYVCVPCIHTLSICKTAFIFMQFTRTHTTHIYTHCHMRTHTLSVSLSLSLDSLYLQTLEAIGPCRQ